MTLSPYLISLQRLALESQLYGFNALARNTRGLLIQETLKAWMESRGQWTTPDLQAWPEPPAQTSPEGNQ
jgi:hypothetical protein